MTRSSIAAGVRTAAAGRFLRAAAAVVAVWALPAVLLLSAGLFFSASAPAAWAQRGGGRGRGAAMRAGWQAGRARNEGAGNARRQPSPRQNRQFQGQAQASRRQALPSYARPAQNGNRPAYPGDGARPAYPGAARDGYANPGMGPGRLRPALPGGAQAGQAYRPGTFPPGHLGSWLNQHRNLPLQGQEQLLRDDPSFNRLPPADQQRLMHQLQQVDRMPPQERERRLERAEIIEHMTPDERRQLTLSSRELAALPPGRQAMVKRAFQDLRSVPLDQRDTVLNSARYQGVFTPEERGILSNLLRAEPYVPPHP